MRNYLKCRKEFLQECDVVFLNINSFCRRYIPLLQNTDKLIVVDIHDYDPPNPYHQDFIEAADVIVASELQLGDVNAFMKGQIQNGKQIVVVTKGKEGLVAIDADYNVISLPGYNNLKYVDSNGAGDSFTSGFIVKYWETRNLVESLKFGSICGRIACTSYELYNSKYDKNEVESLLQKATF